MLRPTTIERAFELARSGDCCTLNDIQRRLSGEGYLNVVQILYGRSLRKQLRDLCRAAQAVGAAAE